MLWNYLDGETQGGFVSSASGVFTPDLSSVMVLDRPSGLIRTPDKPYLFGTGDANGWALVAASYDLNQHRWLPVPRQYVSPDGTAYAYADANIGPAHGVHIVDVATGADRVLPSTATIPDDQANYLVVAYLQDGVYMSRFGNGPRPGLWRLDPASGSILRVSTDVTYYGVLVGNAPLTNPPSSGNPVAWWTEVSADFSASDSHVYYQYLTGVAGQHGETWFERPGYRVNVIGVDGAGHGIVVAQSEAEVEIWLLAESSSTRLYTAASSGPDLPFKTAVAGAGGWWIGSRTGVVFATTSAFTRVSATPAVVVGGCG